jgi:hypothetical protein
MRDSEESDRPGPGLPQGVTATSLRD